MQFSWSKPTLADLSDHKTYLHAIATNHDEWVTNRDHNSWWLDRPPVNGCQESILDRPNQFLTPSSNRSNNNLNPYHQNQYINRDATKNRKFYDFVPNCTPFRNPLFGEEMCFFRPKKHFWSSQLDDTDNPCQSKTWPVRNVFNERLIDWKIDTNHGFLYYSHRKGKWRDIFEQQSLLFYIRKHL